MLDSVRTVLIVEDEDTVRNLLRTIFHMSGFDVISCQDGEDALDLVQARGGAIHLLVSDLNLGPGMDGVELADSIRAYYPALKVVIISGEDESERFKREISNGAMQFLAKPFSARTLMEKAEAALNPAPQAAASLL